MLLLRSVCVMLNQTIFHFTRRCVPSLIYIDKEIRKRITTFSKFEYLTEFYLRLWIFLRSCHAHSNNFLVCSQPNTSIYSIIFCAYVESLLLLVLADDNISIARSFRLGLLDSSGRSFSIAFECENTLKVSEKSY